MIAGELCGVLFVLMLALPLAGKWQLGTRRVGIFVLLTSISCSIVLSFLGVTLSTAIAAAAIGVATLAISVAFLAYRFYRDPERTARSFEGAIVSPADGTVVYVECSEQGELPVAVKRGRHYPLSELLKTPFYSTDAWVIGISMSLVDVHVNRSPVAGRVAFQQHFPGRFGSLRLAEREFDNERATTIIESQGLQVAVVQIASRLVRQIVTYVKVGEQLTLGQRIGAIRLGSQVDVVLPVREGLRVTVQAGDYVKAGETVLASWTPQRSLLVDQASNALSI
jgi:phosphatidylserine decarboxylase